VSDLWFKGEILDVLHTGFRTCLLISVVVSASSSLCRRACGRGSAGLLWVTVVLSGLFLGVSVLTCSCPTAFGCHLWFFRLACSRTRLISGNIRGV